MVTRRGFFTAGVCGLALVGAVVLWANARRTREPAYQTTAIRRGDLVAAVAASGTCNAVVTVQVGSQVSGNIQELYADFNTKVKKGQLVALIDPELFQARANQAGAAVDTAKAAVANATAVAAKAKADVNSAIANRDNLRAEATKSEVAMADAKVKLERRQSMFQQALIAREDVDTAKATYDSAVAQAEAAKAQVSAASSAIQAAEAQAGVAQAQVESTRAQVRQAEASLAQADLDLRHTQILAPVDGTVIARRVDVGQTVAASLQAPTLFEIAQDLTRMQVDMYVDESDIGRIRMGQKATFTVDAYPGEVFPATVSQIREAPINTQNVITYDVVLTVDNSALQLFPGMTANAKIVTDTVHDALLVPNAALRFRPPQSGQRNGQQVLWTLDQTRSLMPVPVKSGLTDGTRTVLISGNVKAGDPVVTGLKSATGSTAPAAGAAASTPRGRGPGF